MKRLTKLANVNKDGMDRGFYIVLLTICIGTVFLLLSNIFLCLIFPLEEENINTILNLATNGWILGCIFGGCAFIPAILKLTDSIIDNRTKTQPNLSGEYVGLGAGALILYCFYGIILTFTLSCIDKFTEIECTATTNGIKIALAVLLILFIGFWITITVIDMKTMKKIIEKPEETNNEL